MKENNKKNISSRREFLSSILMWGGLIAAYGTMGIEGLLFLLPKQIRPTRRLFAGTINKYNVGGVQSVYDLQGNEVLVKRSESGFQAFSTVCPHLGCRVHWEEENNYFFCPCHRGVFDENGIATAGPPAEAKQQLPTIPVTVDEASGVVYLEVKAA